MNVRALVAEALGAFILIFIGSLGISSVIVGTGGQQSIIPLLVVPWAFGLGLLAAIAIGGHASGGHYNPAVTLGAWLDGRITWMNGLAYFVAQLIGGIAASLAILLILSKDFVAATVNHPGPIAADPTTAELHALALEILFTMIFVAVILTVSKKSPQQAIIAIPLTLVVIHFAGMLLSGASVNPVRSIAPAVVSGDYTNLWIYIVGPLAGAVLGWGVFRILATEDEEEVSVEVDEDFDDEDLEADQSDDDETSA